MLLVDSQILPRVEVKAAAEVENGWVQYKLQV